MTTRTTTMFMFVVHKQNLKILQFNNQSSTVRCNRQKLLLYGNKGNLWYTDSAHNGP